MERLTERVTLPGGNSQTVCPGFSKKPCERVKGHCGICSYNTDAWDRLAAYEDANLTPAEVAAEHEELVRLRKEIEEGKLVRLPYQAGDTVYVIANCRGIRRSLDGTMYLSDGSPGTATGYYCAYNEKWDECPLAAGREECDETGYAVFADTVSQITVISDEEGNEPSIYIGLNHVLDYRNNKIYLTAEEARAALGKGE